MAKAVANHRSRALSLLACAAAALACAIVPRSGGTGVTPSPAPSSTREASTARPGSTLPAPTMTATSGLLLHGSIHRSDGTPLAGVTICRRFASYHGNRVAITDDSGEFGAEFVGIPGDEMIAVWPYLEGYSFDPPQVYWRHYHGYEERSLSFAASRLQPDMPQPTPCQ